MDVHVFADISRMTSIGINAPDKELSDLLDFSAVSLHCFVFSDFLEDKVLLWGSKIKVLVLVLILRLRQKVLQLFQKFLICFANLVKYCMHCFMHFYIFSSKTSN